ncbi:MAG: hypothetical protein PW788_09645 [Micavibrio sp.]|nr:hypothetical protein [Micavibrio sp.]
MTILSNIFKRQMATYYGRAACKAAFYGDFDKAFSLIEKGGNINMSRWMDGERAEDNGEANIGHSALRHKNLEALTRALDAGLSPDFYSGYRSTLLKTAIETNQREAALLLIDRGATIVSYEEGTLTPLTTARIHKMEDVAQAIEQKLGFTPEGLAEPAPVVVIDVKPETSRPVKALKPVTFRSK